MVALAPNSCIPYREYGMQLQQSGGKCCSLGGFVRKAGTDSRITQNSRGETRNIPRAFWQDVSRPTTIEMDAINSLEELEEILQHSKDSSQPIVIDWMAAWCRKCIYLKPKLEKLSAEFFPRMKFYFVDVNKVSQALVKRGNISKMPTIQIWKDGEFKAEVIGGHKAWQVLDEVREMIQKNT